MKISTKIITPIVVCLSIFLASVEFALVPYFKEKQLEVIIEGERSELQVLAPIIAEEMTSGDLSKIYSILRNQERIHSDEAEGRIVLINKDGLQIYPLDERILFHEDSDEYLIIEEQILWANDVLGKFRYELEIDHELEHITEQLTVLRGATALVILIIVIFGGWWNRKLVIRPLEELRIAARNIQDGEYDYHLKRHSDDEIAEVYNAFNKMHSTISTKNKELEKAVEVAEAAAHTKSRFLANMSHEIRTPMNAIIGLTHLVQQSKLTREQNDYLDKIQQSSKGLLGIINDILDYSKVEAGQLHIESTLFSLDEILSQVYTHHHLKAQEKQLSFSFERSPSLPNYFLGDPLRINQILTNIVSNAVKFTDQGEVKVSVGCKKQEKDIFNLCFSISDTGIGISEEHMNSLFSSFNQADASTTRKYGGTGLGLSISLQLAKLMGGNIEVKSAPDIGSTFIVELPLKKSEENLPPSSNQTVYKSSRELPPNSKVLLVEDNSINTLVASGMLEKLGAQVTCCSNGKEALEEVNKDRFDLVLMDVQMPVMDGYTATRLIRENDQYKTLPIIALTANAMSDDEEKSLAAGMNAHLSKPIDPLQLEETLLKFIQPKNSVSTIEKIVPTASNKVKIESIDAESAKKRIGCSTDEYLEFVQKFIELNSNLTEQFEELVRESDLESLAALAHSTKGSASTLGLARIEDISAQLEKAAKNGESSLTKALIEDYATAYRELLDFIEECSTELVKESLDVTETTLDGDIPDELLTLLKQLQQLTIDGDVSSLELSYKLQQLANNTPYSSSIESIASLIQSFDLEQASNEITLLLNR